MGRSARRTGPAAPGRRLWRAAVGAEVAHREALEDHPSVAVFEERVDCGLEAVDLVLVAAVADALPPRSRTTSSGSPLLGKDGVGCAPVMPRRLATPSMDTSRSRSLRTSVGGTACTVLRGVPEGFLVGAPRRRRRRRGSSRGLPSEDAAVDHRAGGLSSPARWGRSATRGGYGAVRLQLMSSTSRPGGKRGRAAGPAGARATSRR